MAEISNELIDFFTLLIELNSRDLIPGFTSGNEVVI